MKASNRHWRIGDSRLDVTRSVNDACLMCQENVTKMRKEIGEALSQAARFQIRVVGASDNYHLTMTAWIYQTPPLLQQLCLERHCHGKVLFTMQGSPGFRFLDLPKELRLMVYDRIPCVNDHLSLSRRDWSFFIKKQPLHRDHGAIHGDADSDKAVTIVVQTPHSHILATCRTIHDEALPIISRRRQRPLLSQLRIMCGADFLDVFSQQDGLLDIILNWVTPRVDITEELQKPKSNEKIEDWLLDAELVTIEDTKHPQYVTLTHIIDQVQQSLSTRHALPIEISLFPRNLHMLEHFMEIFYWRAMEKQGKATIKVGMAGPQYYEKLCDWNTWEETLSYVLRDLDDAMDMRSLVYGTASAMKVLRSPKLSPHYKAFWDDAWERPQ